MLLKTLADETTPALDMTPMIDTVFNLLIFFLVAGSFQQQEREMRIALPHATSAAPISAMLREIVVNVDEQGRMIVTGRTVDEAALRAMISEAVSLNKEQKVTVRGDRATAYSNVVRVLDICKSCGIQEPYLDTVMDK